VSRGNESYRAEPRSEQDEPLSRLRHTVSGALDDLVPYVVSAQRRQEIFKNRVINQLWNILHRDEIGLGIFDQSSKFPN
jgi:hypothetical protein